MFLKYREAIWMFYLLSYFFLSLFSLWGGFWVESIALSSLALFFMVKLLIMLICFLYPNWITDYQLSKNLSKVVFTLIVALIFFVLGLGLSTYGVSMLSKGIHQAPNINLLWIATGITLFNSSVCKFFLPRVKIIDSDKLGEHHNFEGIVLALIISGNLVNQLGYAFGDILISILIALQVMKIGIALAWESLAIQERQLFYLW